MSIRPAAVAGSFYQGERQLLRRNVAGLLADARHRELPAPKALVVPHAGYIYSGATAAEAYRQLEDIAGRIERVVLLGPAHRAYVQGIALPSAQAFATPLGKIPLDAEAMQEALALPGVVVADEAHRLEHCLEVQLPFLQVCLGEFSLVPLLVGDCDTPAVAAVIDALWGGPETLVVISSDLSHFEHYDDAREHDLASCQRILQGDATLVGTDACGAAPINGLLRSEHGGRLHRELLTYCNSGDTAGDRQRVVGYAAFSLH